MKASELKQLFDDLEQAQYNDPFITGVHFGCECGCGGDSYTSAEWDDAIQDTIDAENTLKDALLKLGVEWDYDIDDE